MTGSPPPRPVPPISVAENLDPDFAFDPTLERAREAPTGIETTIGEIRDRQQGRTTPTTRPRRAPHPIERYSGSAVAMLANLDDPRTYTEALNDPVYGNQWERATKDEIVLQIS